MTAKWFFIFDAVLVAANLFCIAFGGGIWNGIAAVVLTVVAVDEYRAWRDVVADGRRWTS